jgi:hypothetical protein
MTSLQSLHLQSRTAGSMDGLGRQCGSPGDVSPGSRIADSSVGTYAAAVHSHLLSSTPGEPQACGVFVLLEHGRGKEAAIHNPTASPRSPRTRQGACRMDAGGVLLDTMCG